MIIAFKFNYTNKNNFLAYFLEFYAKKSSLSYSITKEGDILTLFVEGEEKDLLKFSDESMILIPNSIFLQKSEVEVVDEMPNTNIEIPNSSFSNLTPSVVKNYVNHTENLKNEYNIFSEISILKDNEFIKIDEKNYKELLEFCFLNLLHNKTLLLKDGNNNELYFESGVNFKANYLMPTSFKSISSLFIADEKSLIALSSYEKPLINLKINAVFRKNHENAPAFFDIKAASDFFIFALLDRLYEENINFVSVKSQILIKASILDDEILVTNNNLFLSNNEKLILEKNRYSNLSKFGLICDEYNSFNDKNLNIYLTKFGMDNVTLYQNNNSINFLKFSEFKSYDEIKEAIIKDEIGKKLFENFTKKYNFPNGEINNSQSFYAIFDVSSKILFGKDASYLITNAKDFIGKKGPSIDYLISNSKFDTIKLIKSAMSFKLAGVSDKILSFGIVQSLAYFLSDFSDDLEFDNAFLTGDLFEERLISNLILNVFSKNKSVKFSKYFGV